MEINGRFMNEFNDAFLICLKINIQLLWNDNLRCMEKFKFSFSWSYKANNKLISNLSPVVICVVNLLLHYALFGDWNNIVWIFITIVQDVILINCLINSWMFVYLLVRWFVCFVWFNWGKYWRMQFIMIGKSRGASLKNICIINDIMMLASV